MNTKITTNVKPTDLPYDHYSKERYDDEIEKAIPGYDELHNKIAEVIKNRFNNHKQIRVLDLGCGTGKTSVLIRNMFPDTKLTLVDFSEQMLNGAKYKFGNTANYIHGDYSKANLGGPYDLIISVIGLHHQNHDGKRVMFQRAYETLAPGGMFVLGDLMTYEDVEDAAENHALHFHHMVESANGNKRLLREWAHHHLHLNDLAPATSQTEWMKEAGFDSNIEWMHINTGLIIGHKIENSMKTNDLFSKEILNYNIETKKRGLASYVNLDNAATTPPLLYVQEKISDYLNGYGSVHRGAGTKSKISTDIYEKSRDVVKDFVNAPKDSYVLYSANTTSAINTAAHFFSFLKGKVMVSSIEHSSSWLPWIVSEGKKIVDQTQVRINDLKSLNNQIQEFGRKHVLQYETNDDFEFNLTNIEKQLKENDIKVVVLTASSNLTGYCPDIKAIGEIVHKYGAYFLVDACQYLQHHKIDMQKLGIDFLVASGHKFYAPYGTGFLIGPKDFFDKFLPYQIGGGNLPYITKDGEFIRYKNQLSHDPGTPNAVGAVAIMYAFQKLKEIGYEKIEKYEKALSNKLFEYMESNPKIELFVSKNHLSTVLPFRIKGMCSEEVAERLSSEYGIGVRAGSFCVYHVVRKLLGIEDEKGIVDSVKKGNTEKVPSLVRASIGLCNTEKDIDMIIEALQEITE